MALSTSLIIKLSQKPPHGCKKLIFHRFIYTTFPTLVVHSFFLSPVVDGVVPRFSTCRFPWGWEKVKVEMNFIVISFISSFQLWSDFPLTCFIVLLDCQQSLLPPCLTFSCFSVFCDFNLFLVIKSSCSSFCLGTDGVKRQLGKRKLWKRSVEMISV